MFTTASLENNCCSSHNDRGWMLHFNSTLSLTRTPGSLRLGRYGVRRYRQHAVPSYTGTSTYLLLTKYNNYAGIGTGNGVNKVAILDPFNAMQDEYSSTPVSVMQEVITVTGVTAEGALPSVREWCINTAAVDPSTKSAIINSEDGTVYRWDFASNTLSQRVSLTSGAVKPTPPR